MTVIAAISEIGTIGHTKKSHKGKSEPGGQFLLSITTDNFHIKSTMANRDLEYTAKLTL